MHAFDRTTDSIQTDRKAIATARLTELCALKTMNDTAKMALKRRKHTTKMQ